MPKFSQVPTNATPSISDFALGVSAAAVDQKSTWAVIAALLSGNLTANSINSSKIDWAAATGKIWWEELGRTTLTPAGDALTISSLAARKYLRVIIFTQPTGGTNAQRITFNGDTGANYAYSYLISGTPSTGASKNNIIADTGTGAWNLFTVMDITNVTAQEKAVIYEVNAVNAAGAANIPGNFYGIAKWANTAAQISSITATNAGTGDWAVGSQIIVLGHD